jgi:hypothetical protein
MNKQTPIVSFFVHDENDVIGVPSFMKYGETNIFA